MLNNNFNSPSLLNASIQCLWWGHWACEQQWSHLQGVPKKVTFIRYLNFDNMHIYPPVDSMASGSSLVNLAKDLPQVGGAWSSKLIQHLGVFFRQLSPVSSVLCHCASSYFKWVSQRYKVFNFWESCPVILEVSTYLVQPGPVTKSEGSSLSDFFSFFIYAPILPQVVM